MTRKMPRLVSVALAVVALAGATLASAAAFGGLIDPPNARRLQGDLNGYQETPSVSSTGWGEFRAKLVDDNDAPLRLDVRRARRRQLSVRARPLRGAVDAGRRVVLPLRRQHETRSLPERRRHRRRRRHGRGRHRPQWPGHRAWFLRRDPAGDARRDGVREHPHDALAGPARSAVRSTTRIRSSTSTDREAGSAASNRQIIRLKRRDAARSCPDRMQIRSGLPIGPPRDAMSVC